MSEANTGKFRMEKHRRIAALVSNKTFADIGGLWGTVNETVSVAMLHGASEAAMVDIQRAGNKWWAAFHERCRALGVSGYESISGDICDGEFARTIGPFDITHCAGIVYHVPNPIAMVHNLISITSERLILGSMVVPNRIENQFGTLELDVGQFLMAPVLSERKRSVVREYFTQMNVRALGVTDPSTYRAEDGRFLYAPYWWLYTKDTMVEMCTMMGLSVENVWVDWSRRKEDSISRRQEILAISVECRV